MIDIIKTFKDCDKKSIFRYSYRELMRVGIQYDYLSRRTSWSLQPKARVSRPGRNQTVIIETYRLRLSNLYE